MPAQLQNQPLGLFAVRRLQLLERPTLREVPGMAPGLPAVSHLHPPS
jgi:hypothetical protein